MHRWDFSSKLVDIDELQSDIIDRSSVSEAPILVDLDSKSLAPPCRHVNVRVRLLDIFMLSSESGRPLTFFLLVL